MGEVQIKAIVDGGNASGGPPLGPAIGPLGININDVIKEINKQTAEFKGVKVPITVFVNKESKQFRIELGLPPTAELLKKEANVEKGRKEKGATAGNVQMKSIIKIAKMKIDANMTNNLKNAVKSVVGTCISVGLTVDGQDPKIILKQIDDGKYDGQINEK